MPDEDAVQIPEFPVPRCRPGAQGERQGDAAGARAAGPRLRVNHAALVRTKSAGNGSAPRIDDVRELMRRVPGLRLAGHVGAARVAHRYARVERARPDSDYGGLLLVRAGPFDPDAIRGREARRAADRQAHIARLHCGAQLSFNPAVRAGHGVSGIAEVEVEPVNSAVHVLVAADTDEHRGSGLAAGDNGRVVKQAHVVTVASAGDERHCVPGDGGILGRIKADRTVERLVVLDVELQFQAREIGLRQVLQPEVVEVVVSIPPPQYREVLRSLEDPRDGYTGLRGVVDRGGRSAPGEALQLEVPARIEDVEGFRCHQLNPSIGVTRYWKGMPNDPMYSFEFLSLVDLWQDQ